MKTRTRTRTSTREDFINRLSDLIENPPASVALCDIDDFAAINERHGFDVGDEVLALTTRALEEAVQPAGFVVRIGGDEFACALPSTAPEEALLIIEQVRRGLQEGGPRVGRRRLPILLSAGIATFPQHAEEPAELVQAADEAMHRAKRSGKSRVSIYVEDKMVLKSNYYPRAQLARLAALAQQLGRTEASLLREALSDLLDRHRDAL